MTRFGDFLQALHLLQPQDDAAHSRLAELFGLEILADRAAPEAERRRPESHAPRPEARRAEKADDETRHTLPEAVPCALDRLGDDRPRPPAWLEDSQAALTRHVAPARSAAAPAPLIRAGKLRAILSELLADDREVGAPDILRMVGMISRGEVIHRVLRLPRRATARRILVLIDTGAGMEPFARDQMRLAAQIKLLLGADRIAIKSFAGTPLAGLMDPVSFAGTRFEPNAQDRILILGDWGAVPPRFNPERATPDEWKEFAAVAGKAAPIAVLTPYPEKRWPRTRLARVTFLHWSEKLVVGDVRAAMFRPAGPAA